MRRAMGEALSGAGAPRRDLVAHVDPSLPGFWTTRPCWGDAFFIQAATATPVLAGQPPARCDVPETYGFAAYDFPDTSPGSLSDEEICAAAGRHSYSRVMVFRSGKSELLNCTASGGWRLSPPGDRLPPGPLQPAFLPSRALAVVFGHHKDGLPLRREPYCVAPAGSRGTIVAPATNGCPGSGLPSVLRSGDPGRKGKARRLEELRRLILETIQSAGQAIDRRGAIGLVEADLEVRQ